MVPITIIAKCAELGSIADQIRQYYDHYHPVSAITIRQYIFFVHHSSPFKSPKNECKIIITQ